MSDEKVTSVPLSIVIAGGGTAGHIEPALAVAEVVRQDYPQARITALGTDKGLENQIIPTRGLDIQMKNIPAVPVPRKINKDMLSLPWRVWKAFRSTRQHLKDVHAGALIGFGGYVSAPAYLAAASLRIPFFVHEANARAGMANKLGVALGGRGLAAVENSGLKAEVVGIPIKQSILAIDRDSLRAEAREFFGLDPDAPVLLVTGGSQGARSINAAMKEAQPSLSSAGIGILHAYGKKNELSYSQSQGTPPAIALPYIDRMDLALAAADMVLCRSGAMTVAELSAVGLPALYVPLPIGNGEQELNAHSIIEAGGAELINDADLSGAVIVERLIPILTNQQKLQSMSEAARQAGHRDAAQTIATLVIQAADPDGLFSSSR